MVVEVVNGSLDSSSTGSGSSRDSSWVMVKVVV